MTNTDLQDTPSAPQAMRDYFSLWSSNFKNQSHDTFARLRWEDYIRLVAIIGAYVLIIRPLLMKLGAKHQMRELERQEAREHIAAAADSSAENRTTGVDLGIDPALRQRQLIRKALLEHEEMLREMREEEEDDKDIEEFLID